MSWGEIKKAINDTLGTTAFQPLNVVIKDYLKKYINTTIDTPYFQPLDVSSQYRIKPSDNEYSSFTYYSKEYRDIGTPNGSSSETVVKAFNNLEIGISGTIRLAISAQFFNTSGYYNSIYVSKNPNATSTSDVGAVASYRTRESQNGLIKFAANVPIDIPVYKGDTLYFYLSSSAPPNYNPRIILNGLTVVYGDPVFLPQGISQGYNS